MDPVRWRQLLPIYLAFVLAFPLGMAWVEVRAPGGPTLCAFRVLTHLDCPGCGLTRAYRAMGRLEGCITILHDSRQQAGSLPTIYTHKTLPFMFCI